MFKNIKYKDLLYLATQLLLFIIYILSPFTLKMNLNIFWREVGLVVTVIGITMIFVAALQLNVQLSPFPTPAEHGYLITNGVFLYIRHPIYGGILLAAVGYAFNSAETFRLLVASALLILFYFKSKYEEQLLKLNFTGYSDYIRHTGRFLPCVKQLISLSKHHQ